MVELLSLMASVDGYFHYQCESLRSYALQMWKLPEYTAYDMVTVARKSLEIPAILAALKRGTSSLSKLRRICSVISVEDQNDWIEAAERCSSRELERLIAAARPEQAIKEGFIYRNEDRLELRVGTSEDTRDLILRIQDLLSQKENRAITIGEALKFMAEFVIERIDPVKKAERAASREKSGTCHVTAHPLQGAALTHAIILRDQAQCTHVDPTGQRCQNRRWLHTHHIQPRSQGGTDTLENLTTLCSQHHRMVHHKSRPRNYH